MTGWKSFLKADPTEWLLEEENPPVRYFTLTEILECSHRDPEVINARKQIMKTGAVPAILAAQKDGGYWEEPENFYIKTKYKGTVWSFILLAELGADAADERIKNTCEFILNNSQHMESGGFAYYSSREGGGDRNKILPCLTGNMVWSLIRSDYLNDPRVQKGIKWITKYQRFDDADGEAPRGWPYEKYEKCWGRHTCHMSIVKTLKSLSEIPPDLRNCEVQKTINNAAEYLLKHHIYKKSHNPGEAAKPEWLNFGFPLLWTTDLLEITNILLKLGYRDGPVKEAIDIIISKQDEHGSWLLENSFRNRMLVNIEKTGKPGKWITLNAVKAIKCFFS